MKVKVGDVVTDGGDEPVMVILSPADKKNIAAMHNGATKYCCYPDGMDPDGISRWMKEGVGKESEPPTP